MDNNFIDWLLAEMNKREWTQAELARASGLTRQSVSDYINRRRTNPEPDALTAIAHAFKISPITVFRKAGLLPPEGGDQATFEDWQHLLSQLTPDEEEEMRQIIELKIERRQKAEAAAHAAKFKPKKAG
jgi:transcriptional regulator with XRE-family HTH domain